MIIGSDGAHHFTEKPLNRGPEISIYMVGKSKICGPNIKQEGIILGNDCLIQLCTAVSYHSQAKCKLYTTLAII